MDENRGHWGDQVIYEGEEIMEEEGLTEDAPEGSDQQTVETPASDNAETPVNSDSTTLSNNHSKLVIGAIVLIIILIAVGLFLPPISLGERLGLSGGGDSGSESAESAPAEEATLTVEGEFALTLLGSARGVDVEALAQDAFLSGDSGEDWAAAAANVPSQLTLSSNVYTVSYRDEVPAGWAEIAIPAEAQPYQTLDVFGWDGQEWRFIASQIDGEGSAASTSEGPVPQAFALMQTVAPAEPEVAAEVLPAHTLPTAVLPLLTEVSAGTLTLGADGLLLGEIASVPSGGYRQLARATNTGAVVDTATLTALLTDPAAQATNIQMLLEKVTSGGYAGANLDYQGVEVGQRDAFNAFVNDLATALHEQGLDLVITLETPVQVEGEWDTAGQDWPSLGQTADAIYVEMPLDPTAYEDGGEAEQILEWATRQVDRSKLTAFVSTNAVDAVADARREVEGDQALANFGEIDFVEGSDTVEPGQSVEVALSGSASALEWDPESLSYMYSYEQAGQPHSVWLGSEAVLGHRTRLPNRYNLRGIAVRGLGSLSEGAGYAAAIESYLGAAEAPQPASAAIVWVVEDEEGGVVASSTGEELTYVWEGSDEPGDYLIQANFAQGDSVASLGSLGVAVQQPIEPADEPTEVPVVEATPTTAATAPAAPSVSVSPGDADAAVNTPANVRSGPGLGYGIIGGLQTGEKVSLIGRNADSNWLQAVLPDGAEGWIFATLLTVNTSTNVSSLAVVEVDPPTVAGGGDGGGDGGGAAPPPVIAPAGGGSFELGGQTHSLANPTLMAASGMNWVKFQHKWGSGDDPAGLAGRIQQAHGNGLKVLLSIPGGSTYPSSIDFAGYVEFLRGVAALGPDAIEIWNEENIDFEWPAGQIDPTSYVNNMLAPAYNAIKSANPSVMVVSGAPAPTGFDNGSNAWADDRYMAGVAAAGGANYMDCIGVHHNAGATSPNASSGHPAGNNHYSWYFWPTLNMYYNAFGGSRPVCFTELGYLSGQDFGGVPSRFNWASNTTVGQHAQWLAEAASLSANSGKVRLMIIFNVDFTLWSDDPQAGYAMLRPDGSCPSCGPMGQVMGR
jgi:hypothetical protein